MIMSDFKAGVVRKSIYQQGKKMKGEGVVHDDTLINGGGPNKQLIARQVW